MAKSNIDDYTVQNIYPEALVVFVTLDKNGEPIRDLSSSFTVIPDVVDIQGINLTLGSTAKPGQFSILINNTNNKYFIADDPQRDIKNLKENKVIKWISSEFRKSDTETVDPAVMWQNLSHFLGYTEFNRFYLSSAKEDEDYIYLLFRDTGDDSLKYRKFNKFDVLAYAKQQEILSADDSTTRGEDSVNDITSVLPYEIFTVPENEAEIILNSARTNEAFFYEFGGQLEHGRCLFAPMQVCKILLKKRFSSSHDPNDMITAFTGLVDSVSDVFDGKTQMIQIQGTDVTKVLKISLANINPSLFEAAPPQAGQYKVWSHIFSGLQGWEIIQTLILGSASIDSDTENEYEIYGAGKFDLRYEVNPRDSTRDNKNTVMHSATLHAMGARPTDPEETDAFDRVFFQSGQIHLQILPFDTSPDNVRDFSAYKKIFGASFNNWQNEYSTRLDIINEVTKLTNYEFYADQYGDLWYHQPRFNNYHLLSHEIPEIYVLRDDDILSHAFAEADTEVITSVYVVGQPNYIEGSPQIKKMTAFYEDPSLVRKYGRRYLTTFHRYITWAEDCFYYARAILTRINASRFTGKVVLIGRPELRMHMPIYVPLRNMIYYITGIEHAFKYGTLNTTTLTLKYGHKPWETLSEVLDYGIQPNMSSELPNRDPATASETKVMSDEVLITITYYNDRYSKSDPETKQVPMKISELNWGTLKEDAELIPDAVILTVTIDGVAYGKSSFDESTGKFLQ